MSVSRSCGATLTTSAIASTNATARATDDGRLGTPGGLRPTTRPTLSLAAGTSNSAKNKKMPGTEMRTDDHTELLGSENNVWFFAMPSAIAPAKVSGRLLSLPTTAAPNAAVTNNVRLIGSSGPPAARKMPAIAASIDPSIQL